MNTAEAVEQVERVATELESRGEARLAQELRAAAETLAQAGAEQTPDLVTTGAAAEMLGVRSRNTIKRWAREGLLEGFRRGGRVLVTRRSVEQLLRTPTVAAQQAYERELGEVLDAFDPGERPLPELGLTTAGRKPWESSEHVRA